MHRVQQNGCVSSLPSAQRSARCAHRKRSLSHRGGILVCLFAGALLTAAPRLDAQPFRLYTLDDFSGSLGLRYEFERSLKQRPGSSDLREEENVLEEFFSLRGTGSIYHPRFLVYRLEGRVGFEQDYFDVSGSTRDRDVKSTNLEYDALVTVLREHPYTLTLFADQQEQTTRQRFARTTDVRTRNMGSELNLKYDIASRIHYSQTSIRGRGNIVTDEDREKFFAESRYDTPATSNEVRYEYLDADLHTTGQSFRVQTVTGNSFTTFGGSELNRFFLSGVFREQKGTLDTRVRNATATLDLQHLETLKSSTTARYLETRTVGDPNRTLSGDAALTHQLYQSLTSTVGGGVYRTSFQDGRSDGWRGRAGIRYRKILPFGLLNSGYELLYEEQEDANRGDLGTVVDETHAVSFGSPIFLSRVLVDTSSIIVTNDIGTIQYLEGADYLVTELGEITRLDIPPASAIADGQQILIDYRFQLQPDRTFSRLGQNADLSVSVQSWARVYANWSSQSEDLLRGIGGRDLRDSRRYRVGFTLNDEITSCDVNWEEVQDEFNPFQRFNASGTLSHQGRWGLTPLASVLQVSYFRTRFVDDSENEEGVLGSGLLRARVTRNFDAQFRTRARWIDDRVEKALGVETEFTVQYHFRSYQFDLTARQQVSRFDISSDQDETVVYFQVTRWF